ncbi:ImmA/IrrE family metallo-endopeptidase [Acinetobacter sp. YH01003]|uniref:ImmA/IrrE family metallo-endopeptidase n=1 Tax=Acinetobacter sp. YH01003 TaxID=2601019 RepID=UPI0015D16926|nr:ImmA/IrrE family metallo-endopeptidase [Acinetobacter sp. YH01003]
MSYADTVLKNFWDGFLPVDINSIAEKLDIEVRFLDYDELHLSGKASLENGKRIIYVNPTDSIVRQRFTSSHELAHHLLNHVTPENPCFRDEKHTFNGDYASIQERDANRLGADILMPEYAIRRLIEKENIRTVEGLALKFNVSERAMYYRLKGLNLVR